MWRRPKWHDFARGLGEAEGKSGADGVSGKRLRIAGCVLLQGGGTLGWVFKAT